MHRLITIGSWALIILLFLQPGVAHKGARRRNEDFHYRFTSLFTALFSNNTAVYSFSKLIFKYDEQI